jgi:hypothetical protein
MADNGTGATVRRLWLASELKSNREKSKMTAEQAASELDWSHSKVSRIEGAKVGVSATDVSAMCDLYCVSADNKAAMIRVAKEARSKTWHQRDYADVVLDWFSQYVGLEGSASQLRTFEGLVIPGLLQTRDYARAVTKATLIDAEPAEIDRKAEFRMERQSILARKDPPHIWAVLAEGVIRQRVGGAKVMRDQLRHLRQAAERSDVTLQVLPFEAGAHAAMTGPFVIMEFPAPFPQVVYVDYLTSSAYLQEAEDIARYRLTWDHLLARALDPDLSVDLLTEVIAAL